MLDALRKMRNESRTKTAGDQLRQILDAFEKGAGAEGSGLDQPMKDVIRDKFRDSPGITDDSQITPQARQRVAEALGLHEALSKKAEEMLQVGGDEPPPGANLGEEGSQIEVPAPEAGQAKADMTLEQIAEQYGLTTDEFLDFLSEESEDLNEAGQEESEEPKEAEEEPAEPEPEDAAEEIEEGEDQTPKELYQDLAKESARKIAAMKLGLGVRPLLKSLKTPFSPTGRHFSQLPQRALTAPRVAADIARNVAPSGISSLGGGARAALNTGMGVTVRPPINVGPSPSVIAGMAKNNSLRARIKVAMLRRALAAQESFQDRAQRLAETGQLRLLNTW